MKNITLAFALMVLFAGAARADEGMPLTASGNRALLFTFNGLSTMSENGLFTLSAPYKFPIDTFATGSMFPKKQGATTQALTSTNNLPSISTPVAGIGGRWYFADNLALRAGLGFGTFSYSQNDAPTGQTNATESGTTFGVQAMVEWHMTPVSAISPYLGGGLQFASYSATYKPSVASSPGTGTLTEEDGSATQFSLLVNCGFEWFFTKAMSLGAEYQLGLGTQSGSVTEKAQGQSDVTVNEPSNMNIATSSFSVLLSFYIK